MILVKKAGLKSLMLYLRHSYTFVVFLTLIFTAPIVTGKALEDRNWIEVQTTNFRVRSTLGKKKSIELAHHLELFRSAVSVLTNVRTTDSPIPTEIFAFKKKRDFTKFGFNGDTAGIFLTELRNNTVVIRDTRGMAETSIIMHEYVHFIMGNNSSFHYPKWYNEGLAEYLGGSEVNGDSLELGIAPKYRIKSLTYTRWIPIRKIITAEGYEDWRSEDKAMFYAEAWALVHFLNNRPDEDSSLTQQLDHYLQLLESNVGDIEAFEAAFSIEVNALDSEIKQYLRGRLAGYRFKTDALLPNFTPKIKNMSREEVSLALAQLALERRKLELAEHWFTIAIGDETTRPQAESGLGDVLKIRGELDAARVHFETAVSLAPNDPYTQIDAAEYWHYLYQQSIASNANDDYLDHARTHYVKAWKLDDSIPEVYAMYGKTFLIEGKDYAKAIEMLELANELLPSDLNVRIMLARAYAGAGRTEEALKEARAVLAWSHANSDATALAKVMLAQLESGTFNQPQPQ